MTTSVFTSKLNNSFNKSRSHKHAIYQVEAYGEDNEYITFEVVANSMTEATAEAERMAMANMIDLQYVNVTAM